MNYINHQQRPLFITKKGLDQFKKELDELRAKRLNISEKLRAINTIEKLDGLSVANDIQALEDCETEAMEINAILRDAKPFPEQENKIIAPGSKVVLFNNEGEHTFTIVSSLEVDPSIGYISEGSSLGKALLGKRTGEILHITSPKGRVTSYTIQTIQ